MLTKLLIMLFVRDHEHVEKPEVRLRYGALGGAVGIACNVILCTLKFVVGVLSGSVAILADAVNNLSDAGSSVMTLVGFKIAAKPADDEHPFGHGRLEYVVALVIAIIIITVGLDFFKSSVSRIFSPAPTKLTLWGFIAVALAVPMKFWMYLCYRKLGDLIDSAALKAAALDSLSDILTTAVVLVSAAVTWKFHIVTDGYAGVIVAGVVVWSGIKIIRETLGPLLGECPDPELVHKLKNKMLENPDIIGVHDLIIHSYGPGRYFASVHAEVNCDANPVRIHDSLESTEHDVALHLPVRLTIHCDPFESSAPEYKKMRLAAVTAAEKIDIRFRVYDFRANEDADGTLKLRFTLLVPRSCTLCREVLEQEFQHRLADLGPKVQLEFTTEYAYV